MNPPRINNDERGITLNKPFAYSVACGLLVGGLWLGSEVVGTKRMVEDLRDAQTAQNEDRAQYRRDVDARLRLLETSRASDDQRLTNALNLLTRIDQRLERLENRIAP